MSYTSTTAVPLHINAFARSNKQSNRKPGSILSQAFRPIICRFFLQIQSFQKEIILSVIFTFLTAINILLILRKECLIAIGTKFQCSSLVHQHEAEHHLDCQKQGVEVPHHSGLISQFNMIFRGNTLKRCHTGSVDVPSFFFHFIVIFVKQKTA